MLYMVIERFEPGRQDEIYRRVREHGRRLPDGLEYVASWVEIGFERCFQVMRCDDPELLFGWIADATDVCRFEVVPVLDSTTVQALMSARGRPPG